MKPFIRNGRAVKENIRLEEERRLTIMDKSSSWTPYTDELFEKEI
jgi:hypothetical protein